VLRSILTERFALGITDSDAEDLFRALANRRGHDFTYHHMIRDPFFVAELDFACLPALIDIEIDGGNHDDSEAAQRDRNRDAQLGARGWLVLRFTYWDLVNRTDWVFEVIDEALARRLPKQLRTAEVLVLTRS
jgi:adenine-specific DNA-methyltransferase